MFPAWGQLIDHDLTLTAETKDPETRKELDCCEGGVSRHPNCYPLGVPKDDVFYKEKKQTCLNLARSLAGVRPGCSLGSRTQINLNTAYIDANFIYGSNEKQATSLRLHQKGQLKTFDAFPELGLKPLLPPKTKQPDDGCLRPHPDIYCFLAGDNRVNEQLALGVLHTLVVREHNRIASELSYVNPHWDDEKLYQEARHIMAAIVQHITYNEFLPQLLGETFLKQYDLVLDPEGYNFSYDPEVDPTIPASFGSAAFRFGHSLLPNTMQRRSSSHKITGERKLSEMLQQPFDLYKPGWVDAYVLGLVNQISQPMDHSVTIEVTNHLFQEPARDFGRDLAAINLARAREHGVPGYMAYRKHCGLEDMDNWQDMWSFLPNSTVNEYLKVYDHPDDIDLWSAGVSELSASGSMLGPVFSCIIATTFRDLKKGDRFWYENPGYASSFTLRQLKEIKKYTLARMLCNTGDNIDTIQEQVMLLPDYDENPRVSCKTGEIPDINLNFWKDTLDLKEEVEKYKVKPQLITNNQNNGYLPPLSYYPWSTAGERLFGNSTILEAPKKEVNVPFKNGGTENEESHHYFFNPLNLDDESPPFPDLFVKNERVTVSEDSFHEVGLVNKNHKIIERNTSVGFEKYPTSHHGLLEPPNIEPSLDEGTKDKYSVNKDLKNKFHSTDQIHVSLIDKLNKGNEKYPEYSTADYVTYYQEYPKTIYTSLAPPPQKKPDYSSVIENVNELIEKYGNENYSYSTEKQTNDSEIKNYGDNILKKEHSTMVSCTNLDEAKEVISITSSRPPIQDIYTERETNINYYDEKYIESELIGSQEEKLKSVEETILGKINSHSKQNDNASDNNK